MLVVNKFFFIKFNSNPQINEQTVSVKSLKFVSPTHDEPDLDRRPFPRKFVRGM